MTGAAGPDIIICQKQNGYSLSHVSATEWDVAVQNVGKVVDAVLNEALVRSFLTLARTRNVTEAARQLYMSQQGVSKHLARLEEDLGTALFRRERGGMTLTGQGEVYFEVFSQIEELLEAARERADRMGSQKDNRLVISHLDLLDVSRIFKPIYRDFLAVEPEVRMVYKSGSDWATAERLEEGGVDVAFTFLESLEGRDRLDYLVVEQLQEVLVVAADHPLTATAKSYLDFRDEPVFYTPEQQGRGRGKEDRLEALGIPADRLVETNGILSSCSAVEMGQGVTFMTEYCRLLDSGSFRTYPTDKPATLVMAWRKDGQKPALRRFIQFVAERVKR